MRKTMILTFLLVSCTSTNSPPPAAAPSVRELCQEYAPNYRVLFKKIAAANGTTPEEIEAEFVSACEAKVEADIAEIAIDLAGMTDAGKKPTQSQGDAQ